MWNHHIVDEPKVVSLGDSGVMTITSRRGTLGGRLKLKVQYFLEEEKVGVGYFMTKVE